ncbi:MAG: hypothetical protein AAFV29_04055, partial [Myxococcota bacterium]
MSDLNDVRAKLDTFDADNDPEAFWDLLTDQATEQLDADVAFVVLLDEEDEFTVYPADDLEDLEQSFAFMAAIEALGSDAPALHNDPDDAHRCSLSPFQCMSMVKSLAFWPSSDTKAAASQRPMRSLSPSSPRCSAPTCAN